MCGKKNLRAVWQLETTKEGKRHLQMFVVSKSPKALSAWKSTFPGGHIERAKGSDDDNITYCTKLASRVADGNAGPHFVGIAAPFKAPKLEKLIKEPYAWQITLGELLTDKADHRTIHWVWEATGGVGKTVWSRDMAIDGRTLVFSGKATDAFSAVADWVEPLDKNGERLPGRPLDLVIMDVPRVSMDFISYQALEKLKDGCFFNGKYRSRMIIMEHCHVVVFANQPPDMSKMSADRWKVYQIKDLALVIDKPEVIAHHNLFNP